ncbi:hypothetical protein NKR23_g12079 [Pleurostoma richardsiae]|uniref:MYND-type domain-containing protein n=1 Tax=Pleurostoma richardsiae TaxID=41990 RepID=A0AA38R6K5_9PEZI|nr:hypothetical protein NKR23_g12079 [Pleurostoma richardsiae]
MPREEKLADDPERKEKLPKQQYANFRNEETFPTFASLQGEDDINMRFYDTADGFNYTPRKHWCFLAEIVDIEQFIRVKLIVRDVAGATVPVAFHTDDRGTEFAHSQLRPGYTIAILYAHQHGFLDFTTGIRQEEYCGIISTTLAELFQLSDLVHQYSTGLDIKRCHGCDEQKASLQKCSRCSIFGYCNKSCQITGWHDRGHKRDCKVIRDNDLQAMFLLDWDHFEGFVKFPLDDTTRTTGKQGVTRDVKSSKYATDEALRGMVAAEKGVRPKDLSYPPRK